MGAGGGPCVNCRSHGRHPASPVAVAVYIRGRGQRIPPGSRLRHIEHGRGRALAAAEQAGLGQPTLVAEPVAAAGYFVEVAGGRVPEGASLAVYDFGGGTFDASVVVRIPAGFQVLAEQGLADAGGRDVDPGIVAYLGARFARRDPPLWDRLMQPPTTRGPRGPRGLCEHAPAPTRSAGAAGPAPPPSPPAPRPPPRGPVAQGGRGPEPSRPPRRWAWLVAGALVAVLLAVTAIIKWGTGTGEPGGPGDTAATNRNCLPLNLVSSDEK